MFRTLVLAFMIALLPVRGWLGDAMAVEMVKHSMPVAAAMETAMADDGGTMAEHCHASMGDGMRMSAQAGDHTTDHSTPSHDGCGTCTACQACHTVALGSVDVLNIAHAAPQAPPAAHAIHFASAEPAPGLKPPIS